MSDRENDDEQAVSDESVFNKYKVAADITNAVLSELIGMCTPQASIIQLCELGDKRILEECGKLFKKEKEMKKGIAFPTCISVNNLVCHYSPIEGEENEFVELNDGDVVKIDLGAHIDGFSAAVGHTLVVGASSNNRISGRKADAIMAANTAAEAVLRLLRPGNENFKVTEIINKATADYNCHPVKGIQSRLTKRFVYDGEKAIVLNSTEEQKKSVEKCTFELYEVWNVDILVSTGEGKPIEHKARTTVYKKNETLYQLKMKSSRQLYSEITNKCLVYPFNIRMFDDVKKARLGITECASHDVVQSLPVYCEKDDEFVAQFMFTVLLMPNGPSRITGLNFDPSHYKSDYKVKDVDVKELLSQPVKNKKKKGGAKAQQPTGDE